jgi:outer membrane protein TolC
MKPGRFRARTCWLAAALALLGAQCTPTYHKKDADREVYRLLEDVRQGRGDVSSLFTIEPSVEEPTAALRKLAEEKTMAANGPGPSATLPRAEAPEQAIPTEPGAARLTLTDALELAARYSREYQTEKENLYLTALALTLERYNWSPIPFATFVASLTKDKSEKVEVDDLRDATDAEVRAAKTAARAADPNADTSTFDDAKTRTGVRARFDKTKSLTTEVGVSQLLATGGEMTIRMTTDFIDHAAQHPDELAGSVLAVEVVQPLLRGGGRLVAREDLTQAERNTVYAVRSFARFRRTFAFTITQSYYRVLQQRDSVLNAWENYQRLRQLARRAADMARAGRLSEFQVDQARQDELRARDGWIRALRRYQDQLDNFKITLGLPTEAALELAPGEIDKLREAGPGEAGLNLPRAVDMALERRLDLLNVRDQVEDADRLAKIAKNGLLPDLDVRLTASAASRERRRSVPVLDETGAQVGTTTVVDQRRPLSFPLHRADLGASLEGELPLDRKAERNAYREALINFERAQRDATETADQVKLSVRTAWRDLQEAAETYRIQRASVELARRRVESTNDLLQRGDVAARDVLEANEALLDAQNALTGALINHILARLALWRDTELLRVDERGVWQDPTHD